MTTPGQKRPEQGGKVPDPQRGGKLIVLLSIPLVIGGGIATMMSTRPQASEGPPAQVQMEGSSEASRAAAPRTLEELCPQEGMDDQVRGAVARLEVRGINVSANQFANAMAGLVMSERQQGGSLSSCTAALQALEQEISKQSAKGMPTEGMPAETKEEPPTVEPLKP